MHRVVLRGRRRIHPAGDLAQLDEGGGHLGALQRLGIELHEGGPVGIGADAGKRDLELHAVVPADAAIGHGRYAGGLHRGRKLVELGPGRRRLLRADLGHRRLRHEERSGAVDLHRQRDPMALRFVQADQLGRDHLLIAGGGDDGIEVHRRRDLRPGGDFRSLELRGGGRVAGDDVGAQLVHHLGPGTGLCCQMPPSSSSRLPSPVIAAPSLPDDHWEMKVTRGFACGHAAPEIPAMVAAPAVPARKSRRRTSMRSSLGTDRCWPIFWGNPGAAQVGSFARRMLHPQ